MCADTIQGKSLMGKILTSQAAYDVDHNETAACMVANSLHCLKQEINAAAGTNQEQQVISTMLSSMYQKSRINELHSRKNNTLRLQKFLVSTFNSYQLAKLLKQKGRFIMLDKIDKFC